MCYPQDSAIYLMAIKLFISYSHADEELRDQLETHLATLKHQGLIDTWHDRRIAAGDVFDDVISAELEDAKIILLLISSDFIASRYCYGVETMRALKRHTANKARVIPIVLRPCDWHDALFGKLLSLPTDGKPITRWGDIDEAFLSVVQGIKSALTKLGVARSDQRGDSTMAEAEALLRRYTEEFSRTYTSPNPLVPFTCRSDGEKISSEDVAHLVSEQRANILVRGPSGCGKTLLAAYAGLDFNRHGGIAITIPAKDYAGSLKTALNREACLLAAPSAAKLLNAARRLNRPILFVVDGYNECAEQRRSSLTRGVAALVRKYEACVLLTSQVLLARASLLALRTIDVPPATLETKIAIATHASGGNALPKEVEHLLRAISTGLEAKLVGEVGRQLSPGSSRYTLFSAFARTRLGDPARDGIRALSQVAAWLSDRIAFSLSVRDFDRLMDDKDVPHALSNLLQKKGLITLRGDRVSFAHEMFFNAFAAESVIRRAAGQVESVLLALATPQHAERKDFIVGAIDDDSFLEQVLERLEDSESVAACLAGSCGRRPQEWADARCLNLTKKLHEEACNIRFQICDQERWNIAFQKGSLTTYSSPEQAVLSAFPKLLAEGRYLDDILDIIEVLDQRIADESIRLREEARNRNIALRSGLFANSYVFPSGTNPGITWLCSSLHGRFFLTTSDATTGGIQKNLAEDNLSPGQLYLLLMLSRGADITAPFLTRAIKTHWAAASYHLRLDLMDAAVMCSRASEADRTALIETIEALPEPRGWGISSSITDALKSLGAFEDSEREHRAVVREEIRQCIAHPNEGDSYAMAYRIYSAQFDHPFSGAYYEAVSDLSDHDRKTLLITAAKGAADFSFFLKLLLIDLDSLGDPNVGESVARWTALPPTDSVMPEEAIAVFVVAHIALARLGYLLPDKQFTTDNPAAEALAACGTILYWNNRTDLDDNTKRDTCYQPLGVLARHGLGAALGVIRDCEYVGIQSVRRLFGDSPVEWSIVGRFPTEVAEVCRQALVQPVRQLGYFHNFSDYKKPENLKFAIDILAHHGNSTDIWLLRRFAADSILGTSAIAAVKTIEDQQVR